MILGGRRGLNAQPPGPQPGALPIELRPPCPHQELNLDPRLRRPVLYPLSYGDKRRWVQDLNLRGFYPKGLAIPRFRPGSANPPYFSQLFLKEDSF